MVSAVLGKERLKQIEDKAHDIIWNAYCEEKSDNIYCDENGFYPPIDLPFVLDRYGITLKIGDFKDDSILGAYNRETQEIFLAEEVPYRIQTFTIAHELAHFFLHNDKKQEVFYRKNALDLDLQDELDEKEANWFAACMLVPENFVRKVWENEKDIEKLASLFIVSPAVMRWRLRSIGLID